MIAWSFLLFLQEDTPLAVLLHRDELEAREGLWGKPSIYLFSLVCSQRATPTLTLRWRFSNLQPAGAGI